MSAKQAKQPNHDAGVDLAKRYTMLTIAAMEAVSNQDNEQLNSLFNERDAALDQLNAQTTLSREAIRQLNVAARLDDDLQEIIRSEQANIVTELTTIHKGKAVNRAYTQQGKGDGSGGLLERAS
jgi:ABC-type transporter Mla subunit MlaD